MPIPVLGFVFRDASSSAFSSFLATILRIYLLEPCPLSLADIPTLASQHLFWASLFDSTCAIMDVPSLSPLSLTDGHNANDNAITNNTAIPFFVQQYIIKGVHDLPQELRSHVIVFYKELITLMEGVSESWQLMTNKKYTTILTALICIRDGEPVKLLRSIYPQIYKW
jgi:hypothetical protein